MKNRNNNIDIIKAISCIAIVLIHCNFPGYLRNYIKVINRFGVPFFYFVSGYYYSKNNYISAHRIILKIVHILKLIFYSSIFYSIFCIFYNEILHHFKWNIIYFSQTVLTKKRVIRFLITNTPFQYLHLWFLLALLYCYLFLFIFEIIINSITINNIFILLIMLMGGTGYIILGEFSRFKLFKIFYNIVKSCIYFNLINIFFFRALPYFLLGIFVRVNNIKATLTVKKYITIFIIGTILSCIEYSFIKIKLNSYICTFIQLFSLIGLSLSNYQIKNKLFIYIGRNLSPKIYIYHIAIIKIVNMIIFRLKLKNLASFQYLIVLILSLLICSFFEKMSKKIFNIPPFIEYFQN